MHQRNAPGADRLFKIRPIVAKLNENFSKVVKEEYLCVDEQICSTKARNTMKRYNPKKYMRFVESLDSLTNSK